jgi:sulfur-oxidizing protein SoxY
MTTTDNGVPATRRLILQGAGVVLLTGIGINSFNPVAGPSPPPTTNIRKTPSSRRVLRTRSNRSMAGPPNPRTRSSSTRLKSRKTARWFPISVSTTLTEVTSISFLASENPNALAAVYQIPPGTLPNVANRLKMAKTCDVIVIVEAGGKLYSATKEVKVTVGGCGG